MTNWRWCGQALTGSALLWLSACGFGSGPLGTYSVGGQISGLSGPGLVLTLNGTAQLTVPAHASSFVFPQSLSATTLFSIKVKSDPYNPVQQCIVTGGTGTVQNSAAGSIKINCVDVHGEWVWRGGSQNDVDAPSNFGTQGQAALTNQPAARVGALHWTDASGHFWMYGGYVATKAASGVGADLWMYDPSTQLWTWVNGSQELDVLPVYGTQGAATPTSSPGARDYAATWIDSAGDLWLFGGVGGTNPPLGDLWKYNIASGQWSWVSGAGPNAPTPGAASAFWQDDIGSFWLLDAAGQLWSYSQITGQWTSFANLSPAPTPRVGPAAGYDPVERKLLLCGGWSGIPFYSRPPQDVGDVWSFNGFTWNVESTAGGPGYFALSWVDRSGALWVYGGAVFANEAGAMVADSLFNTFTLSLAGEGTWSSVPSPSTNYEATYGSLGIPDHNTTPGPRAGAATWKDAQGNFWFFGGGSDFGYPASYGEFYYPTDRFLGRAFNDIWEYVP